MAELFKTAEENQNAMDLRVASDRASGEKTNLARLRRRQWTDRFAESVIKVTAFTSLAFIGLIIVFVFKEALPVFSYPSRDKAASVKPNDQQTTYGEPMGETTGSSGGRQETYGEEPSSLQEPAAKEKEESLTVEYFSISDLFKKIWQPVSDIPKYGMLPLIAGSFKVTLVAVLLASPIAILAALFTSIFAPKWAKEFLKPCIEVLAGFPSVVIGFFALIVLATFLQNMFGFQYRLNAFVGGVAMSLAVIPIVYTITEDALTAVPKTMTEASLALGITKWQTALFVVLPAATPGVFAAVLLGFGRAMGETMIVLMATGNAALLSFNFAEPVRTMSATIGAEMAEVVFGDLHYHMLFLIGAILFTFTFILNAVAELYVRNKMMKKFTGR